MLLEDIIKKIENVSKKEIKKVASSDINELNKIILKSAPKNMYEKMVIGYLTSICAEYKHPKPFILENNGLDYVGFELENGEIQVDVAGNFFGTCMKGGKINAKKSGDETGKSMVGGKIVVDEIKSIGNTLGGTIITNKVEKISKDQQADIFINGIKYKRSLIDKIFGK